MLSGVAALVVLAQWTQRVRSKERNRIGLEGGWRTGSSTRMWIYARGETDSRCGRGHTCPCRAMRSRKRDSENKHRDRQRKGSELGYGYDVPFPPSILPP